MSPSILFTFALIVTLFSPQVPYAYGIVSTTNAASKSTIYGMKKIVEYVPAPQAKLQGVPASATWSTKSIHANTSTFVIFDNRSLKTVEISWINYQGKEVFFFTLSAGSMYKEETYDTHPWVIRDSFSKEFLTMFVATENILFYTIY